MRREPDTGDTLVRSTSLIIVASLLSGACSKSSSSNDVPSAPTSQASHSAVPQSSIQWGPAPAVFPPGAEMAVLQGDPSKTEEFTVRSSPPERLQDSAPYASDDGERHGADRDVPRRLGDAVR